MGISGLILFLVVIGWVLAHLWITYPGVWVQDGGMLQTATAMGTYLAASKVDLFDNNVLVNSDTTASLLTAATFTGYTQQAITTAPPPVNDLTLGGYSIYLPSHVFACTTAPGTPVTIYGCMLRDTSGNLIAAANFTTPLTISSAGDSVPLQITLNFSDGGLQAIAEVLN